MCNLYSLTPKRTGVARFFRVSHNRTVAFEPVNAIFPRHVAPVVRTSADGEREIVPMSWGFLRLEKGRAPKPVTNVRDDQIQTNPFWRDSLPTAPLPGAGLLVLRAQRRREARDLELVRDQRRRTPGRSSPFPASGDATRGR